MKIYLHSLTKRIAFVQASSYYQKLVSLVSYLVRFGNQIKYLNIPFGITREQCNKVINLIPNIENLKIKILSNSKENIEFGLLNKLKELNLSANELSCISFGSSNLNLSLSTCDDSIPYEKLAALKSLTVSDLRSLKIFNLDEMPNLEKIKFISCRMLEEIKASDPNLHLEELNFLGINATQNSHEIIAPERAVVILDYSKFQKLKKILIQNSSAILP